jgi:uncharacterized membrane protein
MPRAPRATPVLASDITRSTISIGLGAAGMVAAVFVLRELDIVASEGPRLALFIPWCVLVLAMCALTFVSYGRASAVDLRAWLVETGPPRNVLLHVLWSATGGGAIWWAITGAAITMYTLVGLAIQPTPPSGLIVGVGVAVVAASYAMIVVSYAVHYARIDASRGGFSFPGGDPARFIDYVYLAAQVSTTFGSSDVELTTSRARRAVTFQSLLSMAFNTVLISLFVSVLLRAAQPAG